MNRDKSGRTASGPPEAGGGTTARRPRARRGGESPAPCRRSALSSASPSAHPAGDWKEGGTDILKRCLPGAALTALIAVAATLAPPSSTAQAAFGDRQLREGRRGDDVRVLQRKLTRLGHRTTVDGHFGRTTRRKVLAYERRFNLRRDGIVTRRQARGIRKRVNALRSSGSDTEPAQETDGTRAVISDDGRTALAPRDAPQAVKAVVAAANRITRKPYRYGGGHARWEDSGYDCSGAVSYALHGGNLLNRPLSSSGFYSWGRRGKGEWITVFTNHGHAYVVVAGLRFDTSGPGERGPRWRPTWRSGKDFVKRHPAGL